MYARTLSSVVQRHYWLGTRASGVLNVDSNQTDLPDYGARAALFERDVSNRKVGVKIRNLTKVLILISNILGYMILHMHRAPKNAEWKMQGCSGCGYPWIHVWISDLGHTVVGKALSFTHELSFIYFFVSIQVK